MNVLLDTNVISELRKKNADQTTVAWVNTLTPSELFISVVSILHIERSILLVQRRDETQLSALRRWFEDKILGGYRGRVLPVDVEVARRAAALHVPDPGPERDALIAATALVHGLRLATRNVRDFRSTGVSLVNPWG